MSVEKQAIRQQLRERRSRLPALSAETASRAACARLRTVPAFQGAVSVVAYIAHENEISPASLFDEIIQSGRSLYLPSSSCGEVLISWRPGSPLAVGPGGVLQPSFGTPQTPETPGVALLPVVAWDDNGTRLGRGRGFYDRIFPRLVEGFTRIGLAYEFQEVPALPREPWDVPVHYVITEQRVVQCRPQQDMPAPPQRGGLQYQ